VGCIVPDQVPGIPYCTKMAKKTNKPNKSQSKAVVPFRQTNAPAARANVSKSTVPSVVYRTDGGCLVKHFEYVSDVYTTDSGPSAIYYDLNPQKPGTFTWLSAIATRFEQYRFKKFSVHYRPSCSTSTNGYVILGIDFDSYDTQPNKVSMLAWKMAVKAAYWQDADLDISKETNLQMLRFCDATNELGDKRLQDLGKLWILSDGDSTAQLGGEIFVSYECEFRQPSYKIPPMLSAMVNNSYDATSLTDWFGPTAASLASRKTGNATLNYVDKNHVMLLEAGQYLVNLFGAADSGVSAAPTLAITAADGFPNASWSTPAAIAASDDTTSFNSTYAFTVNSGPVLLAPSAFTGSGTSPGMLLSSFLKTI